MANAQSNTTSKLTGSIYDATGAVVVRAKVTAIGFGGKKFEAFSDDRGIYFLVLPFNKYESVRPFTESKYDIIVEGAGFKKSETKGYVFIPSQFGEMHLDVGLEIGEFPATNFHDDKLAKGFVSKKLKDKLQSKLDT